MAETDVATVNFFICGTCTLKLDEPSPLEIADVFGLGAGRGKGNRPSYETLTNGGTVPDKHSVVTTRCGHLFHALCLEHVFLYNPGRKECPSCKEQINRKPSLIRLFPTGYDQPPLTEEENPANEKDESENGDEEIQGLGANGNLGAVGGEASVCNLPECQFFAQVHQTLVNDMRELEAQYNVSKLDENRIGEAIKRQEARLAEIRAENERMKAELARRATQGTSLDVPDQDGSNKRPAE